MKKRALGAALTAFSLGAMGCESSSDGMDTGRGGTGPAGGGGNGAAPAAGNGGTDGGGDIAVCVTAVVPHD